MNCLLSLAKIGVDTAENEPFEVWVHSILFTGVLRNARALKAIFERLGDVYFGVRNAALLALGQFAGKGNPGAIKEIFYVF